MKILVVAAHPDDEVLGCGGTIARLESEGNDVSVLILGEGVTSRFEDRELADRSLIDELHSRCRQAVALLGVREVLLCELPDNRFDTVPLLKIVKMIEAQVSRIAPDVIYTHHGGDLNIDHRITHQAVLTATRPVDGRLVREIYAFEIPSSTEWAFHKIEPVFQPNFFVDITDNLDRKIEALSLYDSEARPFPHPRSSGAIRAIAQRWGSAVGCEAAEAFELIRAIKPGGESL